MKRTLTIVSLILVLSMILAACAKPTAAPTAVPVVEPTKAPVAEPATPKPAAGTCPIEVEPNATITFSGWGDESEQAVYKATIERFKAVCPTVTVNYTPIPADFQTKLKAQMAGGTAPDVFYVDDQLMTAFAPTEQILALDEFMAQAKVTKADFIPALLTIFTQNNKIYALPKDWGTLGLVYLPEVFKEVGIPEPTDKWTWTDLRAAAQKIAAGGKYGGFCMGADWARFSPFATSYGNAFVSKDLKTATLDTPEVLAAAQFVADMFKEKSLVRAADVSAGWCGEAIGKKLVGMTTEGGWMVNFMRNDYADVEWKAVPLPTGSAGQADVIFTNGIGSAVCGSSCKYNGACLNHLIS